MGSKLDRALEKAQEAKEAQNNANRDFLPFVKFPEGKTKIRIIPPNKKHDPDDWFVPVGLHYNVGDSTFPIVCPYETYWAENDCPICEAVRGLYADGDKDTASSISVRKRYYVRVLVRGKEEEGPHIWNLSQTAFNDLAELITSEEFKLVDWVNAHDIIVNRTGTGPKNTRYTNTPLPKTSPVLSSKEAIKELHDSLEEIQTIVTVKSYDDLRKQFLGDDSFGSAGDDFDETFDDDDDKDVHHEDDDDFGDVDATDDEEDDDEDSIIDDGSLDDFMDDDFASEVFEDDPDEDIPSIKEEAKARMSKLSTKLKK